MKRMSLSARGVLIVAGALLVAGWMLFAVIVVPGDYRAGTSTFGASPLDASAGISSLSRLKVSICCTVASSWCAIHASVRPWRTQPRI